MKHAKILTVELWHCIRVAKLFQAVPCSCWSRKNICSSEWQRAIEWRRAASHLRTTSTQCIMLWVHVSTYSFAHGADVCSVRHLASTYSLLSTYGKVNWFSCKVLATFRFLCVHVVMMISQVLATLPVSGAYHHSSVERVHFSWWTLISFLSLIMIAFSLIDVVLSTKVVMEFGLKLYTVGKTLMNEICCSILALSFCTCVYMSISSLGGVNFPIIGLYILSFYVPQVLSVSASYRRWVSAAFCSSHENGQIWSSICTAVNLHFCRNPMPMENLETSPIMFVNLGPFYFSVQPVSICGNILLYFASQRMSPFIVEHSVYIGTAIFNNDFQIKKCNLTVDFWKNYYMRERLQIFSIFNYQAWLIPLVQVINVYLCTYVS